MIDTPDPIDEINVAAFRLGELMGILSKHRHTHPDRVAQVYRKIVAYLPADILAELRQEND